MMRKLRKLAWSGSVFVVSVLLLPVQALAAQCPAPEEAAGGPANGHTRYVETHLQPAIIKRDDKPFTLAERMRQYGVPGLSVAVIHHGKLDWARGWGVRDTASCAPVTPETDFQAASISKVATAVLALKLVEQGKIGLDSDINEALRSWQLPKDPKLAPHGVTLRQLLSHTAGLGIHGFSGFLPGEPLPTTIQILDGLPPSKPGPVRSILPAGAQFEYSGGGYMVAQLALSDATGTPFTELEQRDVLSPLGMTRSAFAQPPSAAITSDVAFGYENGAAIPGHYQIAPQLAPAGLWTTAADLARLLMDIQGAAAGQPGHLLSPAMARQMLTPVKDNWGMGVAIYPGKPKRFGHDGVNAGYRSFMIAYAQKGEGVVVLANAGQARPLMDEVVRAIAADYGWQDIAVPATVEKKLSLAQLSKAAGRFVGGGLDAVIEARPDGLYANAGAPVAERLITISPRRFRAESLGVTVEFSPDFASLTFIEGGPPMKLVRVNGKKSPP
ncbi:serine hydrolase domain-containing protein [Luteibacter sp. Lutesp34]|uniref:serine hydrolase domain-containing protein n=1 Tax=Luteibacter sp. Lutesp34 TaxID=3243030 RepID=UPI0039B47B47